MTKPHIRTEVVHSQSKDAWNIIGTIPGNKYKIARIPYVKMEDDGDIHNTRMKYEALEHAQFINFCFNNPDKVDYG